MSNQVSLTRTLLTKEKDWVAWSLAVSHDATKPLSSRLTAEAVFPQEADRSSVAVMSSSANGRFDVEQGIWSFTVAPGAKAHLELTADLLPEHVG